jgi:hypothetical protein
MIHQVGINLTDDLVEDLLNTSDQDLLQEYDDKQKDCIVNSMQEIFKKSCNQFGIKKLERAKQEVTNNKTKQNKILHISDPVYAREKINNFFAHNKENTAFTMAARNAEELSDQDIIGLYNRMVRLNIISDENE